MSSILIILNGLFTSISGISLAQTTTDASITNSGNSNFLMYEDSVNRFKIQYPSDWNKVDYTSPVPAVALVSPGQNATDKLFENILDIAEPLPTNNITLDQYTHSLIEQQKLSVPEFNVTSPPEGTLLGGIPAYNMTYTGKRADENNPSIVHEFRIMQIWTLKDDKAYAIGYSGTESQFNHSVDEARKVIDSFSFLSPQQEGSSLTKDVKAKDRLGESSITDSTTKSASFSNFSIYENSTYGIRIQYPSNWTIEEDILDQELIQEYNALNDSFYSIANFWPPSENGSEDGSFGIGVGIERLPFQESTMTEYLEESFDLFKSYDDFTINELNTNSSLGGKPAFKHIFSYLQNDIKQTYFQIGTIISGKVYYIYFSASEQEFSQYLPTVEKLIDSLEIVPTDKPPIPPSVNKVKFLTYENSTLGIEMRYPSGSELIEDISNVIGFALPDEEYPESSFNTLFVEVYPLPLTNTVSGSVFLDEYVPLWISDVKQNLTGFNLTKSDATTLDDSPAQRLEYTYTDEGALALESKALSIFAIEDNILYHILYESTSSIGYYEYIPIIQKMIDSFEILETKEVPHIGIF